MTGQAERHNAHMPLDESGAAHVLPSQPSFFLNGSSLSRDKLVPTHRTDDDLLTRHVASAAVIPVLSDAARVDGILVTQAVGTDPAADVTVAVTRDSETELDAGGTEDKNGIVGVPTDQKLLHHFFSLHEIDVQPIATDRFLERSKDEYNAAWLTREIVQNFVDHNPAHPGTLDGVRFTSEPLEDGRRRFRIEGDWPFTDPTGVLSPHSEKPGNMRTAGGNGIGLKQTAIRILRDFDVDKFEIDGEEWSVNYHLAKAEDVNEAWESMPGQSPKYQVKHDWLIATIQETQHSGTNAYIIETGDLELINALEQLPTLGVSSENPYLQGMDYVSEHGAIKWLPTSDSSKPVRGRLFINGQVMNYLHKGATAEDYWMGPKAVTIQLNNVDYQMSIDRPPIRPHELSGYLNELVVGMSDKELVEQLKRSEQFWAGYQEEPSYRADRDGALVLIEKMATQLSWHGFDSKEWQQHFGGKNYVAWNSGVRKDQIEYLVKQGYIVCPGYFEQVGMATASSKLSIN